MLDHHLRLILIIVQAFQPLIPNNLSPLQVEPPLPEAHPASSHDPLDLYPIFRTPVYSDPPSPLQYAASQPEYAPLLTPSQSTLPSLPLPYFRHFDSR
jgi:hypothetical protein